MTLTIVLDTGVLGMLTHPRADRHWECKRWLLERLRDGATAAIPEIADYELRRMRRAARELGRDFLEEFHERRRRERERGPG